MGTMNGLWLAPGGGGFSHIDMIYVYVPAFSSDISRNLV